ncbi:hypothetical protein QYE76_063564 [Lolium multiflorum]|uniref:Integrase catalytic domain-containing protein n=1 Tax=Lolium multiflorum TaxID=4521 RepID=A0AAD8S5S5_LOLMU|nr:hypothetical protein QYE76_063564 [Lolium multiflorum]
MKPFLSCSSGQRRCGRSPRNPQHDGVVVVVRRIAAGLRLSLRSIWRRKRGRPGFLDGIRGCDTIAFCIDGGPQRAFSDVYFIPKLKSSVVSLGQLDELACDIRIRRGVLTILDRCDKLLLKPVCLAMRKDTVPWRWHARFGHLHLEALQRMARNGMVRGLPAVEPTGELCEACLAGKQRRTPFPQQAKFRAEEPLELVHADLCGAITPPTPAGRRYFLLLVDDHSRFMWLVLLSTKDEAAVALKRFQAEAQTEARRQLCTLRTDRGGEFTSSTLAAHFADTGAKRHLTAPYSPQQNGVVERRNQTVVGMARSMMKAKNLPSFFWGEVVTTARCRGCSSTMPSDRGLGLMESCKLIRDIGSQTNGGSDLPRFGALDEVKPLRRLSVLDYDENRLQWGAE